MLPDGFHLRDWLRNAQSRIKFQGLPARICRVGLGQRHRLGLAFNELVGSGGLKVPVVIGRDHLDSAASPGRETEAMKDGSDAVSGATWVSIHSGGTVGMGFSQHAGMVVVADGTDAALKLSRVLWSDSGAGVRGMLRRATRRQWSSPRK